MKYYVQDIARNYLRNVVDAPEIMKVHPRFLQGLDSDQFQEGFRAMLTLIRTLYADIERDPSGFGMALKENVQHNAKNADYTNSNASFVRMPNLLFLLGAASALRPDLSLILDGNTLLAGAKELKITGLPLLLAKLREYGFEIAGLKKSVGTGDTLEISYPDTRFLTAALKAMSDAQMLLNNGELKKTKQYFHMLHFGILENEKVKAPKLTVESICHALDSDRRRIAADLHETVSASSKATVRMGGFSRNDWSCVYTGNKSKKVIMSLQVEQDRLSAKLNLQHIGSYIGKVMEYPEKIRETIRSSGWECGGCHGSCAGGFAFQMDGKAYNKCRCGAFVFQDVSADEISYCQELLRQELACEA